MVIALHDAQVAAANVMAVYSVVVDALTRRMLELELDRLGDPGIEFAWLALGSQARREALPSSDIDSAIVWFGNPDEKTAKAKLLELAQAVVAGLAAMRAAARRARRDRVGPPVRPLAGVLDAGRAQLDRRADPGAGSDPHIGARRQPPGVGGAHRHADLGHVPPRAELAGPPAAAGALRALAPPTDGVSARTRGRAVRRAPRTARSQAGRPDPDHRPCSVGCDVGRGHNRLDARTAARRGPGRHDLVGRCPHARGRLPADQQPARFTTRSPNCGPAPSPTTSSTRQS